MGVLKSAFLKWKRQNFPEIELTTRQIEYLHLYFENVESASSEPLPNVVGKSVLQMLISGFWEDQQGKF